MNTIASRLLDKTIIDYATRQEAATEITRLTEEVERLQDEGVKATLAWGEDKTKTDALAELLSSVSGQLEASIMDLNTAILLAQKPDKRIALESRRDELNIRREQIDAALTKYRERNDG